MVPPSAAEAPSRTVSARVAAVSRTTRRRAAEIAMLAVLVALPLLAENAFEVDRFGRYLLWGVFAISVDLVWGYGGMLTFGHAAFFGGGGYAVAILTTREWWLLPLPLSVALPVAVLLAVLLALLLAAMSFLGRYPLRGVEYAVVTLAVAFLFEQLAQSGGTVTGGKNGIIMNSRLEFGDVLSVHRGSGFYWLAAVVLILCYLVARRFVRSDSGLVLVGIQENEERIDRLGYNASVVKTKALVLSAAMATLAGALFFAHDGIISPSAVGVGSSTLVLLWVVLGGRGTLIGPVAGVLLLSHLTSTLSGSFLDTWLLIVGIVLVLVILVFPAGVLGALNRGVRR